jgi:hypothetical protein
MLILLVNVVHYLSRIISDEALHITGRWASITVIVFCVYWYGRIQVSTLPRGWKRWSFYIWMLGMLAWMFPEAVPLAFFALWYGDATTRKHTESIMEATRVLSSMDAEDRASVNPAISEYADTPSR